MHKLDQMKDNLFPLFVFINNKKMRIALENTKSKTAQTSFSHVNGHAQKWFLFHLTSSFHFQNI